MSSVAGLYRQCKPSEVTRNRLYNDPVLAGAGLDLHGQYEKRRREEKEKERQRREKEKEEKRAAKEKAKADAKRKGQSAPKRKPFDFEQVRTALSPFLSKRTDRIVLQEKPQILTSIANASQASNNLVNAITVSLLKILSSAYFDWQNSLSIRNTTACRQTNECKNACRTRSWLESR